MYPNDARSVDSLVYHIAADSTHPYKAFLRRTTHVPLDCTYVLYVGSILTSTEVKNLLSLISTTWSPLSGISLFKNAPGKSIAATALFLEAIADSINRLVVDSVGELPLL